MNNSFRAMCPHCGGTGCEQCNQVGYRQAAFLEGDWYTRKCVQCGEENGICITNEQHPLPNNKWEPGECLECGGANKWTYV